MLIIYMRSNRLRRGKLTAIAVTGFAVQDLSSLKSVGLSPVGILLSSPLQFLPYEEGLCAMRKLVFHFLYI